MTDGQNPDLEQMLGDLAEKATNQGLARQQEAAALLQEIAGLQSCLTQNTSKENISSTLQKIRDIERTLKERLEEIEEAERTKELIDGPVKIMLLREKCDKDERPRSVFGTYRTEDEVIYAISGTKKAIVRASRHFIQDLRRLALSPDKKRLAFEAYSTWAASSDGLDDILGRTKGEVYVVNIDGTNFRKLSGDSSNWIYGKQERYVFTPNLKEVRYGYHAPKWLDERTLQFTRDEYEKPEYSPGKPVPMPVFWNCTDTDIIKVVLDDKNEPIKEK